MLGGTTAVDELLERGVADGGQHRADVVGVGPDVPVREDDGRVPVPGRRGAALRGAVSGGTVACGSVEEGRHAGLQRG